MKKYAKVILTTNVAIEDRLINGQYSILSQTIIKVIYVQFCDPNGGVTKMYRDQFALQNQVVPIEMADCNIPITTIECVRDITKLSGYPRSNDKTRLEQSNYSLASGRFPLQNAL